MEEEKPSVDKNIYVIVFYTDYRKENEWFLYPQVHTSKKEAVTSANEWSVPDSKREKGYGREWYVSFAEQRRVKGELILDQDCDFSSEIYQSPDSDDEEDVDEDKFRCQEDLVLCRQMARKLESCHDTIPWKGLSWTPRVAVIRLHGKQMESLLECRRVLLSYIECQI